MSPPPPGGDTGSGGFSRPRSRPHASSSQTTKPAHSPACTPARSPAHSPACTPAQSPARSPACTPARSPACTPA
ncbi:unnamed protein product [Bubo scandiacus]